MSVLDPEGVMRTLEDRVAEKIGSFFPLVGKKHMLVARKIYPGDDVDIDDIHAQKRARLRGRTWSVPVYGDVDLVDTASGKVVDSAIGVKLLSLPKLTRRYSYIIEGKGYQADNQWRLKAGAYTRQKANGELETQFNLAKGRGFRMEFVPRTRQFVMSYGTTNVPLLPVLQAMGVPDDEIRAAWGEQVYVAGMASKKRGQLVKLANVLDPRSTVETDADAEPVIREAMAATVLNNDTTRITLGQPFDRVTGGALLAAAGKLLGVSRGTAEVDNRDSLRFKELWSIEDHLPERIQNSGRRIRTKLLNNLDRKDRVRHIVTTDVFNIPVKAFFTGTSLAQQTSQVNPLDMVGGFLRTTVMGSGGISSENAVSLDAKMIDPSHLGFLDPIHTPEGSRTGVASHLSLGVSKRGVEPTIRVFDTAIKAYVQRTPAELALKNVAFSDQYTFNRGEDPKPRFKRTTVIPPDGDDPVVVAHKDVGYILQSPKTVFSMTANLIPFLASDQANRAGMATRHMEQAISLKNREEPLVQTVSGNTNERYGTWERILGSMNAHTSPVAGKVTAISSDAIMVTGEDGKERQVQLYENFPLNDKKAFIHSTPLVKVGDAVKKGQVVADTNFSRNGVLSIGVNLRVGFLPYKGLVFEDGVVISESGAKKLTSEHLYKQRAYLDREMYLGLKKFRANYPGVVSDENARKLDEDGVIKKGETVRPGDVIMTILQKTEPSAEQIMLRGIHKSLARPWKDKSVVWDKPYPGVVTEVVRNGKEVQAHIRTEEEADIGDKLCYDEETEALTTTGWKSIADIRTTDLVATLVDGALRYEHPTATHAYPAGGRMYRIRSQQVDLLVTEKHGMFVKPRGKTEHALYPAVAIAGKRVAYKKNADWVGADPEYVTLPEMEVWAGQGGVGVRTLPAVQLRLHDYLMLLGAYLADGNVVNQPGSGSCGIEITKIKEPNHTQLRDALTQAGFHCCEADGGKRVKLYSKQLLAHLAPFGHAHEKFIPDEVFTYSQEALKVLFQWLMWGDGRTSPTSALPVSYCTTSARLADDVQRLCLHIGKAANIQSRHVPVQTIPGTTHACRRRYDVRIINTKFTPTVNHGHARAQHAQEEFFVENYSRPVYCVTVPKHVLYVRRGGKPVWSGNSGRHGNKGIVVTVLPDEEMPHDRAGNPLDIMVNPSGVPGRINIGQVLETSLAKVADKRGSPYAVDNFQPSDMRKIIHVRGHWRRVAREGKPDTRTWVDPHEREIGYQRVVQNELAAAGVEETEELFDPSTKKSLGRVLVGKQYFLKLMHQVDKKSTARSHGHGNAYDQNLQPKGGGSTAAQRFGELGYYAMLAHGATANLREAASFKSDRQQDEVWAAIQTGAPLPPPVPSFAYEKFVAYMNALGLDVEKRGNDLVVMPSTDEQILGRSNGALTDPSKVVRGKDLRPEKGGLFDEEITGGPGGRNFSHIELATRIPNPVFEKAILALLGLRGVDYDAVIEGRAGFDKEGQLVDQKDAGLLGPAAITERLKRLDVDKELAKAKEELGTARKSELDRANRKVKYLEALKRLGMSADRAYTIGNIPVLPPIFRPVSAMEGGDLNIDGVNMLYRDVALINAQLGKVEGVLPDEDVAALRKDLYDAVDALMGVSPTTQTRAADALKPPGILTILSGRTSPKTSYFHEKLMDRGQDLSMRSIIVPDMTLALDEVGLPRKGAMKIFRPFVIRELVRLGHTPLQARDEVEKRSALANQALEAVVSRRPVLFKRDPVLHKFGIMAFMPRLHDDLTIRIHPLVTSGFNADFDGDAMAVFVPVSQEAVDEAKRMLPSQNLFNPSTGVVMYQPTQESQLGIYLMTQMGKRVERSFDSPEALLAAATKGEIQTTDVVTMAGKRTTAGRVRFNQALPASMRSDRYLTDPDAVMGKGNLQEVMKELALKHPGDFAQAIDRIKNLGFAHSYDTGFSFDLTDFDTLSHIRDEELGAAELKAGKIRSNRALTPQQRDQQLITVYSAATKRMGERARVQLGKTGNKLFAMHQAGVKPGWAQLQQLLLSPMLLENARGRIIPVPVTKSYSEGLDTSGYWVASSGARKGLVDRVLQTQKPGALSKQIINTVIPYVVTTPDCHTTNGVALDIGDTDLVDRFTAKATTLASGKTIAAGTLITPTVVSAMKAGKVSRVVARSPLKCEAATGMCAKCYGLLDGSRAVQVGTNIGVIAGQAIGERGTQLSMRTFHSGGLAGTGDGVVGGIDRVGELLRLPAVLPNVATISHVNGAVQRVDKSPVGGWDVTVGDEQHYVPARRDLLVKAGDRLKKGQPLSSGSIDPRELLEQTNVGTVQRYLVDEIHNVYAKEGIKRRNIEVVVKAVTNLGKVENPGDSDQHIRGDYVSTNYAAAWNKAHPTDKPIDVTPVLRGMGTLPLDQSDDWMARMQYQKLRETLVRAAGEGWKSNIHGLSPTPGIVYGAQFGRPPPGSVGPY